MGRSKVVVAVAAAVLAGCVSAETQRSVTEATSRFDALTSAQGLTFFELNDARGLTGAALQAEEQRVYSSAISPVCEKAHADGLTHGVSLAGAEYRATGSMKKAYELPAFVRNLDLQFSECLNSFGAHGRVFVRLRDGSELSGPDFLDRLLAAGRAKRYAEASAQAERQRSATVFAMMAAGMGAALGGGVNPNQTYVGSYIRSDGTIVRGHWRTMPNATCWDNLSGC